MEAVAVVVVAEEGLKETLNETLWPGAIEVELFRPDTWKPAPTTVAREIRTLALPVFVSETVWEFAKPMGTEEKVTDDGVAERVPNSVSGVTEPDCWPLEPTDGNASPPLPVGSTEPACGAAPAGGMIAAMRIAQPRIQPAKPVR